MTREDGHDFILAAIVLSVIVHVVCMFFIRPRVMTRIIQGDFGSRHREAMTVTDAPVSDNPVAIDLVEDLEAGKDAPTAGESVRNSPSAAIAPESARIEAEPAPEALRPETLDAVPPTESDVPVFKSASEVVKDAEVAPVVPFEAPATPNAAPSPVAVAPITIPSSMPTVGAPVFTVPEVSVKAEKFEQAPSVPEFEATDRVLASVDEGIVEAEKSAVRDLLNVATAKDLVPEVELKLSSAQDQVWRYFEIEVKGASASKLSVTPKDLVILIDASGSIGSERLISCRKAAKRILRSAMNTGDRFNVVAFRDSYTYAFNSWRPCDAASFAAADRWLNSLAAHGWTDVFASIRSVLTLPRDPRRPLVAMVVTDGDANKGVSETAKILSKFSSLNDGLISVYMYGVKSASNRELIDVLTRGNRGESVVHEGSRWSAGDGLEGLSDAFRNPMLTDLRVVFAANSTAEVYPRLLKNLYVGNSVKLIGRAPRSVRELSFSLRGLNGSDAYEGWFKIPLSSGEFDSTLPSRWESERSIDAKLR